MKDVRIIKAAVAVVQSWRDHWNTLKMRAHCASFDESLEATVLEYKLSADISQAELELMKAVDALDDSDDLAR